MKKIITLLSTAAGAYLFVGAAAAETIPERLMMDLTEDFALEEFQAAGIVGNLARETGNFRYLQEINPLVEGSRGGIGYSQWTGSRRDEFEAWADGRDLTSYEVNYGFLVEELTGAYARVITAIKDTDTAQEAAEVFMKRYLIPHPSYQHLDERVSYAVAYLEGDYSGAGCQAVHEVEASGRMLVVSMCPEPEVEDVMVAVALAAAKSREDAFANSEIWGAQTAEVIQGVALRSDPLPVDPFDRPTTIIEVAASAERSSQEVIYGLLSAD